MKDTTPSISAEIPGFAIPPGARAVLVTAGTGGGFNVRPIQQGASVLNIDTELFDHLNSFPHSDEFLEQLRDYCDGRLAARREARGTGGFAIPRAPGRWEIAHVAAFQTVS